MNKIGLLAAVMIILFTVVRPGTASAGLVFDGSQGVKNIALLFAAPEGHLSGPNQDVDTLAPTLQNFGFVVSVDKDATATEIISQVAQSAREVGENGTLYIHFSGHALEDGQLEGHGITQFTFRQVLNEMLRVRTAPIRRLIVTMDACYSGYNVTGPGQFVHGENIFEGRSKQIAVETLRSVRHPLYSRQIFETHRQFIESLPAPMTPPSEANRLYREAIVVSSADYSQPSSEDSLSDAYDPTIDSPTIGRFSFALNQALTNLRNRPGSTLGQLLDHVIRGTILRGLNGELGFQQSFRVPRGLPVFIQPSFQVPVYRVYPRSLVDEPLR